MHFLEYLYTCRSKNSFGMSGINRLGNRTESLGANISALHKNEPDTVYSPKDGMDMFETRVSLKGSRYYFCDHPSLYQHTTFCILNDHPLVSN